MLKLEQKIWLKFHGPTNLHLFYGGIVSLEGDILIVIPDVLMREALIQNITHFLSLHIF